MKKSIWSIVLLSLVLSSASGAATEPIQESSAPNVSVLSPSHGPQKQDIDSTITNSKMRADLGSKSRWSLRNVLTYQGSTVNTPFNDLRPDYRSASLDTTNIVYLSADLAMKYAFENGSSLNLGTGAKIDKPFHRTLEDSTSRGSNLNISTPFLEYNKAYKAGSLQMISAGRVSYATENFDTDFIGKLGVLQFTQTLAQQLGTRFTGGMQAIYYKNVYKDSNSVFAEIYPRNDTILTFAPYAEYAFNDQLSFRTVFGYFQFKNTLVDATFRQLEPYQSLGLGISISRDIYLYPNVQFTPKDIRSDRTNVGLITNLNLF